MLKKMVVVLAVMFLMAGPVLADSFTIDSVNPGIGLVGQINFTVNDDGNVFQTWGYCIQDGVYSYIGKPYTGEIRELKDTQLWQAKLIYDAYHPVDPSGLEAKALQEALWGTVGSFDLTNTDLAASLRSMYKWADVTDILPGIDGDQRTFGQDFIIAKASPVPEPATLLLLGFGLIGMGVGARRKFVKCVD